MYISANGDGVSVCTNDVSDCADSPSANIVRQLANNDNLFMESFIDVFTKMINKVSARFTHHDGYFICG